MKRFALVIVSALILQGCAGVGLTLFGTGTGVAAGTGVNHTLSGITYKTFNLPANQLRLATLKTLHRLDMKVTGDKKIKEGLKIDAKAAEREIEIELQVLTKRTTRMRVVVSEGVFFKDAATATEIILQTADTLDREVASAKASAGNR